MTSTESEKLGRFALDLTLDAIPGDVLTLAKEHFLDALGIALASSRFDFGEAILNGAGALGDGTQATAIGSGVRLPAPSAALVNGVLAHGLDFDDTHIGAVYHATSPALAAALAAGEANGASGAEVLIAFTSALEIGCRLATVGAGAFHDRAFHPTSLCGTFAAAVVAGRLAKVDHETMTWALGLCGSQASGILERGTSWLKRLHPGWAAHCGLSAMALARAGFTGPNTVFEGGRGFYASHIQRIPTGDDLPSHDLGRTWQARGIALKPYPCCHFIHGFVDAALELRGKFDLADIERIDCPLDAGPAQDGRRAPRVLHPARDALSGDVQRPVRDRGAGAGPGRSRDLLRRAARCAGRARGRRQDLLRCRIRRATIRCISPARSSSI